MKTYVEFLFPGILLPEYETREVDSRNIDELEIPDNAFAFTFFDIKKIEEDEVVMEGGRLNTSERYYCNGQLMTINEVEAEYPNNRILLSNLKAIGCSHAYCGNVVRNFQPFFSDRDILIEK